jgi:predicted transcriptional regulator
MRLVEERPGIRPREAADELRTTPQALYRAFSDLMREGKVRRLSDGGYLPL